MNQSELAANSCNLRQARENACDQERLVLVLFPIGSGENGASFVDQSQSVVKQDQSKRETFDLQLKTALIYRYWYSD